jgi:flagellar hook-length control protein FliK
MIRMISSANFKSSDAKTNFPSDSGEPETDDFAALLDGMSFVIPPIVQQPLNLSANVSPENTGESSIDLQSLDALGDGTTQSLPSFDDSVILPESFNQVMQNDFTSAAPENLFTKVSDVSANTTEVQPEVFTGNMSVLPKSFDVKPELPTARTEVQPDVQPETEQITQEAQPVIQTEQPMATQPALNNAQSPIPNQFAASKDLFTATNKSSAKKDAGEIEYSGERNSSVNPNKNFFDQIESVQTGNISTESDKSPFKISENQLSREMFGGEGKSGAPNKLPKLFREVSSFFEVSDLAMKSQPQTVETAAPVQTESANVAAQIEPQVVQMIAAAIRTEKPQILKMRLNPAELGGVEIKIEKDANGKINAHFTTEKEETQKILTENIAQLRDSLQDSGWQVERVKVSCDSFSFGGNDARENSSQAGENAARNSFVNTGDAGGSANTKEDLNSEKSDRLLSVRA